MTEHAALFIGEVAIDEYYRAPRWPGVGDKVTVETLPLEPGGTIANAAAKDPPVLVAGVLVVAIVYMLATLTADLILAWMNPRARLKGAG